MDEIEMAKQLFEGAAHTAVYGKFRPVPPLPLIDSVLEYLGAKCKPSSPSKFDTAIDVACGTGQATNLLSPHFAKVYGYDISQGQIEQAKLANKHKNVVYGVSPAETLSHKDKSADLITVAQGFHWLDTEKFYPEVRRVLKPNGVLALTVYEMPFISIPGEDETKTRPDVSNLIRKTYGSTIIKGHWAKDERAQVDSAYSGTELPLKDFIRQGGFYQKFNATGADLVGYILTWSGYNTLLSKEPDQAKLLLENFAEDVKKITNAGLQESQFSVKFNFHVLMARN